MKMKKILAALFILLLILILVLVVRTVTYKFGTDYQKIGIIAIIQSRELSKVL